MMPSRREGEKARKREGGRRDVRRRSRHRRWPSLYDAHPSSDRSSSRSCPARRPVSYLKGTMRTFYPGGFSCQRLGFGAASRVGRWRCGCEAGLWCFFVREQSVVKSTEGRVSRLGGCRMYNNENRIKKEGENEGVREQG